MIGVVLVAIFITAPKPESEGELLKTQESLEEVDAKWADLRDSLFISNNKKSLKRFREQAELIDERLGGLNDSFAHLEESRVIKNDPHLKDLYQRLEREHELLKLASLAMMDINTKIYPITYGSKPGVAGTPEHKKLIEKRREKFKNLEPQSEIIKNYVKNMIEWMDRVIVKSEEFAKVPEDGSGRKYEEERRLTELVRESELIEQSMANDVDSIAADTRFREIIDEMIELVNRKLRQSQ